MQKHCAVFLFTYSAFGPGFLAGTLIENHFKSKASNYLSYRPVDLSIIQCALILLSSSEVRKKKKQTPHQILFEGGLISGARSRQLMTVDFFSLSD